MFDAHEGATASSSSRVLLLRRINLLKAAYQILLVILMHKAKLTLLITWSITLCRLAVA